MEHSFNAVAFTQNYPIAAKSNPQLGLNTETNASKSHVWSRERRSFVRQCYVVKFGVYSMLLVTISVVSQLALLLRVFVRRENVISRLYNTRPI